MTQFIRGFAALALLALVPVAQSALPVKEHVLSNGMRFLIVEDHTSPSFMGAWVAHVGSANEQAGQTGLTHLLEHMMFKGSKTIGTRDLAKDLDLIARQEAIKDEMRLISDGLRWKVRRGELADLPSAQKADAEYQALAAEFQTLVEAQRENMVPNEFDQVMQKNGELFGNAFTNSDMTAYFNVLPANRLELWFWMESDRLANAVFREFYAERDVVREERRMRTEADPTGIHEEAVGAMFWQAHPYRWPVIGWASDVEELALAQAQDYFHTYYGPGNVTALLAGDVDAELAIEYAERYFGRLEARPTPPPVVTLEPEQRGEKRYVGVADVNPTVTLMVHCGGFGHVDSGGLQMIASLLNGDTGRLQRSLVQDQEVAVSAYAWYDRSKYGGSFTLQAEAAEGVTHEVLEAAMLEELRRLSDDDTGERELQKVKNNFLVGAYRDEQNPIRAAFGLLTSDGLGDWHEAEGFRERVLAVEAPDVRRLAGELSNPNSRLTVWYERPEGAVATAEPAGLSELPPEMKQMAKSFLKQLESIDDPAVLQGILAQIEGAPAGGPPEALRMNEILKSALLDRMVELQGVAAEENR